MTNPYVVELGGHLCHLTDADAIVFPEHRRPGGWRCMVVARRRPVAGPGYIDDVTYDQLCAAPKTVQVDPHDPDGCAMLWLAKVWQTWPSGAVWLGAGAFANDLRQAGTLQFDLDPAALRRLLEVTRLRIPAVQRLIERLAGAELLIPELPGVNGGWGTFYLNVMSLLPTGRVPRT